MTGPETIELLIDGQSVVAGAGDSVLDAALEAGVYVPHLCDHPDLPVGGVCRLCVVEVDGVGGVVASCATPAREGMVVRTQSEEITRLRRLALELLLVGHPPECGTCQKYLNCELQSLKQYLGVEELRIKRHPRLLPVTGSNPLFVYEPNKCVLCGRCVRACCELREVGVLHYRERDGEFYIYTSDDGLLAESGCRFCGACAEACPTGAIQDKDGAARDKNRKAALVALQEQLPGGDRRAPVRPLDPEGDTRRSHRGDPGEGPLPTRTRLRLRPSLRERMSARRGQPAHCHQRA